MPPPPLVGLLSFLLFVIIVALFWDYTKNDSFVQPPQPPKPPQPPPPKPEPSCYIKGIVKSLKEEKEMWKMVELGPSLFSNNMVLNVEHTLTKAVVTGYRNYYSITGVMPPSTAIVNIDSAYAGVALLSNVDSLYLLDFLRHNPVGQLEVEHAKAALEADRRARAEGYFEGLGCPSGTPTEQPQVLSPSQ